MSRDGTTHHQGACKAPLKLLRAERSENGRCALPILHTAGGLVGGDQLRIDLTLHPESRAFLTSVAAQKVYGSAGRSRLNPKGEWTEQRIDCELGEGSDLEWFPQEIILYENALHQQSTTISLHDNASFFSAEIARLGRSAAKESIADGCLKTELSIKAHRKNKEEWILVDRVINDQKSFERAHGLAGAPVIGTLVWISPTELSDKDLKALLNNARHHRKGLDGSMHCGPLAQGMIARYVGHSSRDARFWFSRIWLLTRILRGLNRPQIPRSWPMQEKPFQSISP